MPYIRISITQKLTEEKQKEVVNGLGEALSKIPGKDGSKLTVDMEDGKTMYMGGVKQDDMVFVDVSYYSNFEYHIKKDFTVAAFDTINRILGTSKEKMFLTINEYNNWGAFGNYRDEYYSDVDDKKD